MAGISMMSACFRFSKQPPILVQQFSCTPAGSIRIALGSDYPFPLGERHPGKMIEEMELDNNKRSNLLADAALDWLALKRKDFE